MQRSLLLGLTHLADVQERDQRVRRPGVVRMRDVPQELEEVICDVMLGRS